MKTIKHLLLFSSLMIILLGCPDKNTPEPSSAELQLEKLTGAYNSSSSKTWGTTSVKFGGTEDRTADWANFTITISTNGSGINNYSTANAFSPGPWPASGTWSFGGTADNPNINQVVRGEDGLEIAVAVDGTTLTLTFTFDDTVHAGGRAEAVNGEYVFSMTAQ